MIINIFIMCYNEENLIEHTIKYYLQRFPNATIYIQDNCSTDSSVEKALKYNCKVLSFKSNNILNEYLLTQLRNTIWKNYQADWSIVIDMDEWLDITENDLIQENNKGTTILKFNGFDMIGNSTEQNLSDIDLNSIEKCIPNKMESKHLCFKSSVIESMNYTLGAHESNPKGIIQYSENIYNIKHMSSLGIPYLLQKHEQRYKRAEMMRTYNISTHYKSNESDIVELYYKQLSNARSISSYSVN
jgi:glycosyltransferase involved in cell wall biosynthesis